ncbi:MAG TPA: hypothetical protein VFK03_01795 [Candidatus Saccharimonadales bacterium]|nr:hypothetical protein [Candidatus Saccharimonadales bacterium]
MSGSDLKRKLVRNAPYILLGAVVTFVFAALVAGEIWGAYNKFWWWDDVLHGLAGVILGFIGFVLVYFFNARYQMHINPLFVAVFAFSFAVTMGVVWEVFEFSGDALFHSNMQRWADPASTPMIGQAYQGSGLRDSMSDLIVASIGALVTSIFVYLGYKHDKTTALTVMRRTVKFAKRKK